MCANSDFVSKNKVFEVGAADYLTLPLQPEEAIARVNHQLNLAHQTHRLHQESQQREQALRDRQQAEDRYRSIFENATEGIFQASIEGRFIDVNPALARFYGYDSPEDLISSITNIGQQLYVQPKRRDELLVYLRQFGQIRRLGDHFQCQSLGLHRLGDAAIDIDGGARHGHGQFHRPGPAWRHQFSQAAKRAFRRDLVTIDGPVSAGDVVVVRGVERLQEGQRVTILTRDASLKAKPRPDA